MGTQPGRLTGRQKRKIVIGLAGILLAAVLLGNRGFRRLVGGTIQLRRLRSEMSLLKLEEARLQKSIQAAGSDDRALERAARSELGYLKPGEVEYRFPPPGEAKKK